MPAGARVEADARPQAPGEQVATKEITGLEEAA
jgi:hypothetical protein